MITIDLETSYGKYDISDIYNQLLEAERKKTIENRDETINDLLNEK